MLASILVYLTKKIGNNKYVLKSYLGNDDQPNSTPMIYQVKVLNSGKLKVYDYPESETLHPYSSVEKKCRFWIFKAV